MSESDGKYVLQYWYASVLYPLLMESTIQFYVLFEIYIKYQYLIKVYYIG